MDADVLLNLIATDCALEICQALNVQLLAPPTVCAETLYLESDGGGGERLPIDLAPLEQADILLRVQLEGQEADLMVDLARVVDDGEAEVIAIAQNRRLGMPTDDRKARRVATERGVSTVSTPQLLRRWQTSSSIPAARMSRVLTTVTRRSHYRPPRLDPLVEWWMSLITDR